MADILAALVLLTLPTASSAFGLAKKSGARFLARETPSNDGSYCGLPAVQQWSVVFAGLAPHAHSADVSRAYQPRGNDTLLVETDVSAWNNVRMSWETAVCLAYKTRRLYRVPHIPTDTYADVRLKFVQNGQVRKLNMFDYFDEESFRRVVPTALDSDPLPAGKVFDAVLDPWMQPIGGLTGPNYTHLVYREGPGHAQTRVFTQYANNRDFVPHDEYIRLIQSAFRIRQDLICRTVKRLVSHGLSPLGYIALHRRQGDTVHLEQYDDPSATEAAEFVAPLVRNKTVLVLTDTYDNGFLVKLRERAGAARVVCWANQKWQGDDLVFAAQVDMLAAVAASEFIGSRLSTFSTGIVRWRTQAGTHKVGQPVYFTQAWDPGYEGWVSPGAEGTYL